MRHVVEVYAHKAAVLRARKAVSGQEVDAAGDAPFPEALEDFQPEGRDAPVAAGEDPYGRMLPGIRGIRLAVLRQQPSKPAPRGGSSQELSIRARRTPPRTVTGRETVSEQRSFADHSVQRCSYLPPGTVAMPHTS